ncbi:hypothetical protein SERLA73DRAFT_185464 [Serpula lacrymans var. lacrymans S7.3]|uniref:Uncharacterized protein n=2 Tax=Serpula lacrymans var. lacrymans TaxID=341189 RepID=F8Q5V4_SERL3|nr:uncharacterized protein SERLADRAFT_473961 [Serpula lacrymans var. lacrymans S7.9]EGN95992.1 hypothetical protein SERLA73DRAFT_185464 [Serpula lacrymans var. lacrymans S7.3]EGO21515.1 hypothetical protein SERLADRAFT_473961 [Serpula lacrymans var. lacrymans S7.9]
MTKIQSLTLVHQQRHVDLHRYMVQNPALQAACTWLMLRLLTEPLKRPGPKVDVRNINIQVIDWHKFCGLYFAIVFTSLSGGGGILHHPLNIHL